MADAESRDEGRYTRATEIMSKWIAELDGLGYSPKDAVGLEAEIQSLIKSQGGKPKD